MNSARAAAPNSKIRRHGWERPREGFVKPNIDASFSVEEEKGASGAVIRIENGKLIAPSSCGIAHVPDAPTAEARVLWDALILAGQIGCNRVMVNSDCICMEVVEIMRDGSNSSGPAAALYEECSFWLEISLSIIVLGKILIA
ncbi:retrotransposon expressed [Hordeum vulgare]|nr:retrotransposon expressed [Hordeum vulgare]